ncbi:hypothetical protein WNZ15_22365 [Roseibium sp. AS2]|uniref:hypothetical protein n=1 Tax=Roseibium sp. AS2 TaxID=3135781 RepID=UPI00316B9EF5
MHANTLELAQNFASNAMLAVIIIMILPGIYHGCLFAVGFVYGFCKEIPDTYRLFRKLKREGLIS